jgi:hypothetical protein
MQPHSPRLPHARGSVSEAVLDALLRDPGPVRVPRLDDVGLLDDDAQLALWCCYEMHYSGFAGVDEAWEWEPGLLAARRELERVFVDRLVDEIGPPARTPADAVAPALLELANGQGPSLSQYLLERGTRAELRELLVHRSVYQRKEADPHTWAIPRIGGRAKSAMVTIQFDEYGAGVADAMHAELFATTMKAFDLDPAYGAYLDVLPGSTLATDNLVTMFGLHRAWRAACVGHLALFEMTSVEPMARYSNALRRLGADRAARRFYDVHIAADAVHQHIALDDMVAGMLEQDPDAAGRMVFGARALTAIERHFSARMLDTWAAGSSSLLCAPRPERVAS